MTLLEIACTAYTFLTKISPFISLVSILIISIPKLSEQIIGRKLAGSLEKQKIKLQMELEDRKKELQVDLQYEIEKLKSTLQIELQREVEKLKSTLQQQQIEDQRKYTENSTENKRRRDYIENRLNCILLDLKDTASNINNANKNDIYRATDNFLGRTIKNEREILLYFKSSFDKLADECEKSSSLSDDYYCDNIRHSVSELTREIESILFKLKDV